jgi:hypothetical protein
MYCLSSILKNAWFYLYCYHLPVTTFFLQHTKYICLRFNVTFKQKRKMNFYQIIFNIPHLPDSSLQTHLLSTFCSASRSVEESGTFSKPSTFKAAWTTVRSLSSNCLNMASWMSVRPWSTKHFGSNGMVKWLVI